LFLAASAAGGLAQDLTTLVVARTVQGAAAGGLMTLTMATVGDLGSPRERGRFQGYITATFAVATVAGPLIDGLLVQHASWRWVFYVNIPLGLLALAAVSSRLPAVPTEKPDRRFDGSGAAMLAGATAALALACIWGGTRYAWAPTAILVLIAEVAIASAGMFLATASLFRGSNELSGTF
jgi:MFS family permease